MSVASTVGTLAIVATVLGGAVVAGRVAEASQRAAGAADAAALAAADTLSGRVPGIACESASMIAQRNGTSLAACDAVGLVVTISVATAVLGFPITATARAGPPG